MVQELKLIPFCFFHRRSVCETFCLPDLSYQKHRELWFSRHSKLLFHGHNQQQRQASESLCNSSTTSATLQQFLKQTAVGSEASLRHSASVAVPRWFLHRKNDEIDLEKHLLEGDRAEEEEKDNAIEVKVNIEASELDKLQKESANDTIVFNR